jgi:hypothetical protein
LALPSSEFNAAIAGNAYRFSGASQERHCDGKLFSIDANFAVTTSTGAGEDVVVSFGVSASDVPINVTSVVSLPASSASSYDYNSTFWSGYQFCNNNGGYGCPTTPSTAAQASKESFTQPNVYVPTGTGAPNCYGSTACVLDIWAGLDTSGQGGAYLLQAGSTAEIYNNEFLGHVTQYYLFWEDVESGSSTSTVCTTTQISPGDTIAVEVIQVSGDTYYAYATDSAKNLMCGPTTTPYTFNHTPYFNDFIFERASIPSGGYNNLPKFDTTTLSGQVYWSGWYPISRPWGDGWYQRAQEYNSNTLNMCSGSYSPGTCTDSVSGGTSQNTYGSFVGTWITSHYA